MCCVCLTIEGNLVDPKLWFSDCLLLLTKICLLHTEQNTTVKIHVSAVREAAKRFGSNLDYSTVSHVTWTSRFKAHF
jgi:hypothetical protein